MSELLKAKREKWKPLGNKVKIWFTQKSPDWLDELSVFILKEKCANLEHNIKRRCYIQFSPNMRLLRVFTYKKMNDQRKREKFDHQKYQ